MFGCVLRPVFGLFSNGVMSRLGPGEQADWPSFTLDATPAQAPTSASPQTYTSAPLLALADAAPSYRFCSLLFNPSLLSGR